MVDKKCPLCGAQGRIWNRNPVAFRCPNCMSIYSEFGLVLEAENDNLPAWN